MNSLLYTISCILSTFTLIKSEEKCNFSMYCHKDIDKDNRCMNVTQTEAFGIYKVGFRSCENQRLAYCNVYDGFIQPSNFNAKCEERFERIQSYPGGRCLNESDCLYGICVDNICKDSDKGKFCFRDENCPIGTACMEDEFKEKRCLEYKAEFDNCQKSTDCKFNYICAYNNCMPMFDYDDNSDITVLNKNNVERLELICKSGFTGTINKKTLCLSLKNVKSMKDKCNEDCQYIVDNKIMTIPNTCKCGFNYQRSKHCILGSGEDLYIDFIALKIKLFNDESYTKYCHTVEKFNEGYCAEKIKSDRSIATRRKIQEYNNIRILALEHHRLINADDCIKNVVFDYDTSSIIPDNRQCAAFSCNKDITYCAYGTNPLNDEGNNVAIMLNEDQCKTNEICKFNQRNGIDFIYENYTMIGECTEKKKEAKVRLPGEDCSRPEDCINHNCDRINKCVGKSLNEDCSSHIDCVSGLYCDNGKCQWQRKESESCNSSWDCLNNLGCYSNFITSKNQCMKFGSVSDIDISQMISKWPIYPQVHQGYNTSELGTSLMCKTGQLSVSKTRCAEYIYDINHSEMTKINENNLIECKANSNCYYLDTYKVSLILKCECGYNSDGKGYCPLPNSLSKTSNIIV